jgi:hypothetical protein
MLNDEELTQTIALLSRSNLSIHDVCELIDTADRMNMRWSKATS